MDVGLLPTNEVQVVERRAGKIPPCQISSELLIVDSLLLGLLATLMGAFFVIGAFLKWLLPYFTYAEDRRNKNRKIVTGIFYVVGSGHH